MLRRGAVGEFPRGMLMELVSVLTGRLGSHDTRHAKQKLRSGDSGETARPLLANRMCG